MSVKNLVSVLIPAYNHENYVQDTLQSIINQTYKNIELIVFDDGSSDNTWTKIKELQSDCEKRFARVVMQTKVNEGTCTTLNKMLDLARGEFIYLIASDDIAKPQAIEKEVAFLEAHNDYALVVGDDELIDSCGKICYWDLDKNIVYDKNSARFITFADFLSYSEGIDFNTEAFGRYDNLYCGNHIPNGYLIRKSIFDKIGKFTKEAPLEDWWLMLQISKYAKIKFIDEILFSYRWHNANSIKNKEIMDNFSKMTKDYEKHILARIDDSIVLPSVLKIKYGYLYKTIGIPYILVLEKYKCGILANANGGGGTSERLSNCLIFLSLAGQNNSHHLTINLSLENLPLKSWGIPYAF